MENTISSAELKAHRERMGLSTRWLAERWGTQESKVQRWERNRSLPPGIQADVRDLISLWHEQVSAAAASEGVLVVPVSDHDVEDGFPAAWHRSIGLAAGRRLDYRKAEAPCSVEALQEPPGAT